LQHYQSGLLPEAWNDQRRADVAADLWIAASRAMYDLQKGAGGRYLHVLQPNQYLPGSKTLTPGETAKAWRPNQPSARYVAEIYPRFLARKGELREPGRAFLDATGLFRDVEASLYIDSCCHFSSTGNRLLADAIVEHLRASKLLEGLARPRVGGAFASAQVPPKR
jgi:hypothetical protein